MNHPVLSFYRKNFNPDLSEEQEKLILSVFRQEHYKKKELIFKQGDRNTRHYIIEKGLVRLYLNDYSGKEFNILFAKENQIIGDLSTPEPASYFLEFRDKHPELVQRLPQYHIASYLGISAEFLSKIIARSFS